MDDYLHYVTERPSTTRPLGLQNSDGYPIPAGGRLYDTDVEYFSLPSRSGPISNTRLSRTFPTDVGVATKTNRSPSCLLRLPAQRHRVHRRRSAAARRRLQRAQHRRRHDIFLFSGTDTGGVNGDDMVLGK